MADRTISVYWPYSTSPRVSEGRIMCFRDPQLLQRRRVDQELVLMPEVGRNEANSTMSMSPSHCTGMA